MSFKTLLNSATNISDSLISSNANNAAKTLRFLGERMISTRRFLAFDSPNSSGHSLTLVPRSQAMVWDKSNMFDRGWERSLALSNNKIRLQPAKILKPSDFQIHEVWKGQVMRLDSAPKRWAADLMPHLEGISPSETRKGNHFHFILLRHRVSISNVLHYFNRVSGGSLPISAFSVSVMPSDASGVVTQRLSVETRDLRALTAIVKAANSMPHACRVDGVERFCRLQPIGYFAHACSKDAMESKLQYSILLHGLTGCPNRTLATSFHMLRAHTINYVNPLVFGGTQHLLALSEIYKAKESGDMQCAMAMLLAISARSGRLRRLQQKISEWHLSLPTNGASWRKEIPDVDNSPLWFREGISLLLSPEDKVHSSEVNNWLRKLLPQHIQNAVNLSTPLLAWNATASSIAACYAGDVGGLNNMRLPLEEEFRFEQGDPVALCASPVGNSLPLKQILNSPSTYSVDDTLLKHIILPLGIHSETQSMCNVGWAAIGAPSKGSCCYGYRSLLVQPADVQCCVCYSTNGNGEESHLMTDVEVIQSSAARVGGNHDRKSTNSLSERFSNRQRKTLAVIDNVKAASSKPIVHSLAVQFQLPPATDPATTLASFLKVSNDLTFVPEDNGMHIALKELDSSVPDTPNIALPLKDIGPLSQTVLNTDSDYSGGNLLRLYRRNTQQ